MRGCTEGVEEPAMIFRQHRGRGSLGHVQAGATDELPRIGFLHVKDIRDVTVRIVECLSKNVRSPLCRRQPLEQNEYADCERIGAFGSHDLVRTGIDRFGQPGRCPGLPA